MPRNIGLTTHEHRGDLAIWYYHCTSPAERNLKTHLSIVVSSSSKCLSLISSFFIWVSTSRATKDLILRSSTAAKCFALTAAAARAAAAAVWSWASFTTRSVSVSGPLLLSSFPSSSIKSQNCVKIYNFSILLKRQVMTVVVSRSDSQTRRLI